MTASSWSERPWLVVDWTPRCWWWRLDVRCGICGATRRGVTSARRALRFDTSALGSFPDAHTHPERPPVETWADPWINPTGVFPDGLPATLYQLIHSRR